MKITMIWEAQVNDHDTVLEPYRFPGGREHDQTGALLAVDGCCWWCDRLARRTTGTRERHAPLPAAGAMGAQVKSFIRGPYLPSWTDGAQVLSSPRCLH